MSDPMFIDLDEIFRAQLEERIQETQRAIDRLRRQQAALQSRLRLMTPLMRDQESIIDLIDRRPT